MMDKDFTRASKAASNYYRAWRNNRKSLSEDTLIYLDVLMDTVVGTKTMRSEQLIRTLSNMLPDIALGTIRRLVNLKFGCPGYDEILSAGN